MHIYSQTEHLRVFHDRSELFYTTGESQTFEEGKLSPEAQERLQKIRSALSGGFLVNLIDDCRRPNTFEEELLEAHIQLLESLVDSITSEIGRAVVGLTILQLCVKAIEPEQSIRLHKGSNSYSATRFSWCEGIPMRSLDKNYITPVLRANNLLRINADGFMMTRSFAENYPYSKLYKAAIRGARHEWLEVVDLLENGELEPKLGLRYLITLLLNKTKTFEQNAEELLSTIQQINDTRPSSHKVKQLIANYIGAADYSARLLEVAMHSLFQVFEDRGLLDGELKPLSQMRSANKKHGNIADIEVSIAGAQLEIIEAWDAKYGKSYLRDELEELNEKLRDHLETQIVGFVTDQTPNLTPEILSRVDEIEEIHSVTIYILTFESWIEQQLQQIESDTEQLAQDWLTAFAESLCQKRRDRAPIDEPSDAWVSQLNEFAKIFFTA